MCNRFYDWARVYLIISQYSIDTNKIIGAKEAESPNMESWQCRRGLCGAHLDPEELNVESSFSLIPRIQVEYRMLAQTGL